MKKIASDIIILHMCTKNHNHMMYASWKMECNRHKFLSFWTIFCRFTTQLTPKFKIWKKCTERPGDIIFLHMCKWRSCDVWFLRYKAQKTEFLVILGHFLPSDPPNNLNNQNFEKFKKKEALTVITILHLSTTNDDHMMYGSWDMESDRENFCHFGPFLPFYLTNNTKNQNFEKNEKNAWTYHHFTQV